MYTSSGSQPRRLGKGFCLDWRLSVRQPDGSGKEVSWPKSLHSPPKQAEQSLCSATNERNKLLLFSIFGLVIYFHANLIRSQDQIGINSVEKLRCLPIWVFHRTAAGEKRDLCGNFSPYKIQHMTTTTRIATPCKTLAMIPLRTNKKLTEIKTTGFSVQV